TDGRELERLRMALRADEPWFGELINYRRDGTAFWNALSLVPLHDEDGLTSHWIGTQTDVTPLRRRALRRAARRPADRPRRRAAAGLRAADRVGRRDGARAHPAAPRLQPRSRD